jgi:hypothetical protein
VNILVGDRVFIDHSAILEDVRDLYQSLLNDYGIRGDLPIKLDPVKLLDNLDSFIGAKGRKATVDDLKEARRVVAVFSDPPDRDWAVCAYDWERAGIESGEADEDFPPPVVVSVDLLKKVT